MVQPANSGPGNGPGARTNGTGPTVPQQNQRTFCFLSQLLGKRVYAADGQPLGRVHDLVATLTERYPEIERLVLARGGERLQVAVRSSDLIALLENKRLTLGADVKADAVATGERQFLVRQALYDKQIVDVNGAKVERVNDVQILVYSEKPFLVHVDVGLTGLTRRLGFEGGLRSLARLVGRKVKDELIGWKFVQPLESSAPGALQVTVRREQMLELHPGELADIIEELDRDERLALVRSIGAEDAAEALEEADIKVQTSVLRDLDSELAADILEEMEPAVAVDVIEELPADAQKSIMAAMEVEEREQLELLAQAQEETAASLMTIDFISCPEAVTAAQALEAVKREAAEVEHINYVYCVDAEQRLRGIVSLRDLILAQPEAKLSEFMSGRLAVLHPEDPWDTVADQFWKYRFKSLPVVDADGHMGGVVTFRHSFEELLPHYQKLAA